MKSSRTLRSLLLVAGIACSLLAFVGPAAAQQRISVSATAGPGPGGMGMGASVSAKDLEKFSKILSLTPDQKEAAQALHSAFESEAAEAVKSMREKMEKVRKEAQENEDWSSMMTEMPKIMETYQTKSSQLEKNFMGDLKALLDDRQAERWPTVERTHRRAKYLPQGMLSGESVNLVEVVEGLSLPAPLPEGVAQPLGRYEEELDKALVERSAQREEAQKERTKDGGGGMRFDMESIQKMMAEARKAGVKIRDINERYAKMIEGGLTDPAKDKFTTQVKKQTYPRVYRESYTAKAIKAAEGFSDLDTHQREGIAALKESYERDIEAANEKWAAAIAAKEADGSGDPFMMMFNGGGDDESDEAVARKARRQLDKASLDKLNNLLNEDQKTRLPEKDQQPQGGPGGGFFMPGGGGGNIRVIGGKD